MRFLLSFQWKLLDLNRRRLKCKIGLDVRQLRGRGGAEIGKKKNISYRIFDLFREMESVGKDFDESENCRALYLNLMHIQ